ncbi:hypothetical protein CIW48_24410 [Methylobacterium sp. P1-11]|nr:hypothetical protein CIW48_24410 [Methylobacterium sp. P1-11]
MAVHLRLVVQARGFVVAGAVPVALEHPSRLGHLVHGGVKIENASRALALARGEARSRGSASVPDSGAATKSTLRPPERPPGRCVPRSGERTRAPTLDGQAIDLGLSFGSW